jgi:hypothetical protein
MLRHAGKTVGCGLMVSAIMAMCVWTLTEPGHAQGKPKAAKPPYFNSSTVQKRRAQQERGIATITCPPPARPACGSNH